MKKNFFAKQKVGRYFANEARKDEAASLRNRNLRGVSKMKHKNEKQLLSETEISEVSLK